MRQYNHLLGDPSVLNTSELGDPYLEVAQMANDSINGPLGDPMAYGEPDYFESEIGAPMPAVSRQALMNEGRAAAPVRIPGIQGRNFDGVRAASAAAIRANEHKLMLKMSGRIPDDTRIPFIDVKGGKIETSPILSTKTFRATWLAAMMKQVKMYTPYSPFIVAGIPVAGSVTLVTGVQATERLFTGMIIKIGTSELEGVPSSNLTISATLTTKAGAFTIVAGQLVVSQAKGFETVVTLFPWTLIQNEPEPILGAYITANTVSVTITGLQDQSQASLILPGTTGTFSKQIEAALIYQ